MRHFILILGAAATTFLIGAAAVVLTDKQIELTLILTWIFNTVLITGIVEFVWYTRARSTHDKNGHQKESSASSRAARQHSKRHRQELS